jgi:ligand-binding sensor domain-containing protein
MNQFVSYLLHIVLALSFSLSFGQGEWEIFNKDTGLEFENFKGVHVDQAGNLWFVTHMHGVMRYDGVDWITYGKKEGLSSNYISSLFEDSKGNIWLGGFNKDRPKVNGIMKFNGTTFDLLARIGTLYFHEDQRGYIWATSFAGPTVYFDGDKMTLLTKKSGALPANIVHAFQQDQDGNIWLGTRKGLAKFDGNDWEIIVHADGEPIENVRCIAIDQNNNLWVGCKEGIHYKNQDSWKFFTEDNGLKSDKIFNLQVDSKNRVWAISGKASGGSGVPIADLVSVTASTMRASGIVVWTGNEWINYGDNPEAPMSLVTKMYEDSQKNLWFDTYEVGFHQFNNETWKSYRRSDGFASNHFTSIFEDSRGILWFGLGTEGIGRLEGETWTFYSKDTGLPGNQIRGISEDHDGNLWFATNKGAIKYIDVDWKETIIN